MRHHLAQYFLVCVAHDYCKLRFKIIRQCYVEEQVCRRDVTLPGNVTHTVAPLSGLVSVSDKYMFPATGKDGAWTHRSALLLQSGSRC